MFPVRLLPLALLLALAPAARAVIIDSSDGSANTSAPADDPGWVSVGRINNLTGVYVGNGWMLTANHVIVDGNTFILLDGQSYDPDLATVVRLHNPEDGSPTDLKMFQLLDPPTDVPAVVLSSGPAQVGEDVVMIGYGRNRGTAWDLFSPPNCNHDRDGWRWGTGKSMRWGTNQVQTVDLSGGGIHHFDLRFDRNLPTAHEAIAANGDSGGAVFAKRSGTWELVGIMYAADQVVVGSDTVSPLYKAGTTCSGLNFGTLEGTRAAEVFTYAGQIRRHVNRGVPSASAGGRALLAALFAATGLPLALRLLPARG